MSYLNRLSQNVTEDTNNSSSANLAPLATFVGLPTSTLGVAGIQVGFKADQNCTVLVEQSTGLTTGIGTMTTTSTYIYGTLTTKFSRDFVVGDQVVIAGESATRYIATVPNDSTMTTTIACTGVSTATYTFYPWDISDSFDYKHQLNENFGKTTQAILSYERVKVTNLSDTETTSVLRLNTCLCPVVEPLPRSLSAEGNLKVGIFDIEDEQGTKVKISPNGALKTAKAVRLIGTNFSGTTIDTNFWTSSVSSGGTGVQIGGEFQMVTGATANGLSTLQSTRSARYVNGVANYCRIQANYGTPIDNNTKRWGCFTGTAATPTDGAMFELINQVPSIATYNGGTPTRVSNGSFNGSYGLSLNSVPTGLQTFEIIYNNRYVYFMFNNSLVHKVEASTAPWSSTMNLPCRAENYNTLASTTNSSLKIRSIIIMRYGEMVSQPTGYYHAQGTTVSTGVNLKTGAGNLHSITFQSLNNSIITLADSTTALTPVIYATTGVNAVTQPVTINFQGVPFYNGLRLGVTGANAQVTVIYE